MSGPRGAGGDEAPSAEIQEPKVFRAPTEEEQFEIRDLFVNRATADEMLEWLQKHPDVRTDWMADKLSPSAVTKLKPKKQELYRYFRTHYATFIGRLTLTNTIPPNHPLVAEILSRNPRLEGSRNDRGETLFEFARDSLPGEIEFGQRESAVNRFAMIRKMISEKQKAKKDLPALRSLTQASRQKGLPETVQSLIGAQLTGRSTEETPRDQLNAVRTSVGMAPKGGRRTRRRNQKRKTRRRH